MLFYFSQILIFSSIVLLNNYCPSSVFSKGCFGKIPLGCFAPSLLASLPLFLLRTLPFGAGAGREKIKPLLCISNGEEQPKALQKPLTKPLCFEKKDITFLNEPGVYELLDTKNDKSYYGQSSCLIHRLDMHRNELAQGFHTNAGLNAAIRSGICLADIQFIVLECGPEWALEEDRLDREDAYVQKNAHRTYNFDTSAPQTTRTIKPIMVYGTRYESTRAAVAGEKAKGRPVARSSILRYLKNPNNKDVYYLSEEEVAYGEIPIFGQKEGTPSLLFTSYTECVAAGFATNKQNAKRKIDRKETGWKYAHVNEQGKPIRTPYTLKEGEIKYTDWINTNKMEKREN
jgi:hypothetical protein